MELNDSLIKSVIESAFPEGEERDAAFEFERLTGGFVQTNVKLSFPELGTSYVVTLADQPASKKMQYYCQTVRRSLQQAGVPNILEVVAFGDVEDGELTYTVTPFVKGEHHFFPSEGEMASLGQALGAWHCRTSAEELLLPPVWPEEHRNSEVRAAYDIMIASRREKVSPDWRRDMVGFARVAARKAVDRVTNGYSGWRDQFPQGVIHGDFHVNNVLFTDGEVAAILDFEKVKEGCLLTDISEALAYFCADKEGRFDEERARAFLNAYHQERPLTRQEVEALPEAIVFASKDRSPVLWALARGDQEQFADIKSRTKTMPKQVQTLDPYSLIDAKREELEHYTPPPVSERGWRR